MKTSFRTKVLGFVFVMLTSAMSTANAVPIVYNWTGAQSSDGWTATGEIVIDDSSYGTTLNANTDFLSWIFQWTDGTTTNTLNNNTGVFAAGVASLSVDPLGNIQTYTLCAVSAGACSGSNDPNIFLQHTGSTLLWQATIGPSVVTQSVSAGVGTGFGGGSPATPVPLPGTLALLGAGFLAMSVRRRKPLLNT